MLAFAGFRHLAPRLQSSTARDACQCKRCHVFGPGGLETGGCSGKRRTRCKHIVNKQDAFAHHVSRTPHLKRMVKVLSSLRGSESSLPLSKAYTAKVFRYRNAVSAGYRFAEQLRLIEASLPATEPVHRHGHNHVKCLVARNSLKHQLSEWPCQGFDFGVLEQADQFAKGSFIIAVGVRCVEADGPPAAASADLLFIQRISARERSQANPAAMFGDERARHRETGGANWNSREVRERSGANAALVRKQKPAQVSR